MTMEADDYKLTPTGQLGSRTAVCQNDKFLDDFATTAEALEFVRRHMEESKFYPNVWWVSDHGNAWQIDLEGNEIKTDEEDELPVF